MEKLTIKQARAANKRLIETSCASLAQKNRAETLYRIVSIGPDDAWTCNSKEWELLLHEALYPEISPKAIKKAQTIIAI